MDHDFIHKESRTSPFWETADLVCELCKHLSQSQLSALATTTKFLYQVAGHMLRRKVFLNLDRFRKSEFKYCLDVFSGMRYWAEWVTVFYMTDTSSELQRDGLYNTGSEIMALNGLRSILPHMTRLLCFRISTHVQPLRQTLEGLRHLPWLKTVQINATELDIFDRSSGHGCFLSLTTLEINRIKSVADLGSGLILPQLRCLSLAFESVERPSLRSAWFSKICHINELAVYGCAFNRSHKGEVALKTLSSLRLASCRRLGWIARCLRNVRSLELKFLKRDKVVEILKEPVQLRHLRITLFKEIVFPSSLLRAVQRHGQWLESLALDGSSDHSFVELSNWQTTADSCPMLRSLTIRPAKEPVYFQFNDLIYPRLRHLQHLHILDDMDPCVLMKSLHYIFADYLERTKDAVHLHAPPSLKTLVLQDREFTVRFLPGKGYDGQRNTGRLRLVPRIPHPERHIFRSPPHDFIPRLHT